MWQKNWWGKFCVDAKIGNRTQDHSLSKRARYPYATTSALSDPFSRTFIRILQLETRLKKTISQPSKVTGWCRWRSKSGSRRRPWRSQSGSRTWPSPGCRSPARTWLHRTCQCRPLGRSKNRKLNWKGFTLKFFPQSMHIISLLWLRLNDCGYFIRKSVVLHLHKEGLNVGYTTDRTEKR